MPEPARFDPKILSVPVRNVVGMFTDAGADYATESDSPVLLLRGALSTVRNLAQEASANALSTADSATLIDLLGELRRLHAAAAALEAHVQVAFDSTARAAAIARGVDKKVAGKGIAEQVALARGLSPYRAANEIALARGLVQELPETLRRLTGGVISEQAAMNVARETVCLMPDDRALVDSRIAEHLAGKSPKQVAGITRAEAAKVDGESVVRRIRLAEQDRCVTVRPAPDAMVYLSALLPVAQGVAAYAALGRHADTLRSTGPAEARSRGAIMADALVARLTGIERPDQIPVEIQLVMPAGTLLGASPPAGTGAGEPAQSGLGEVCGWIGEHPIPGPIAREIALVDDARARRWIRRLFTDAASGEIAATDSRRRRFTGRVRQAIVARDRTCRGCGAPIRHIDHVTAYAAGGPTTTLNGQGHCERCNQAKAQPGWRARAFSIEGRHVTVTRTPTGHRYVSKAPPPIIEPPPDRALPLERRLLSTLDVPSARERSPACCFGIDVIVPIRRVRPERAALDGE